MEHHKIKYEFDFIVILLPLVTTNLHIFNYEADASKLTYLIEQALQSERYASIWHLVFWSRHVVHSLQTVHFRITAEYLIPCREYWPYDIMTSSFSMKARCGHQGRVTGVPHAWSQTSEDVYYASCSNGGGSFFILKQVGSAACDPWLCCAFEPEEQTDYLSEVVDVIQGLQERVEVARGSLIFEPYKACLLLGVVHIIVRVLHFYLHPQVEGSILKETLLWGKDLVQRDKAVETPIIFPALKYVLCVCITRRLKSEAVLSQLLKLHTMICLIVTCNHINGSSWQPTSWMQQALYIEQ